MPLTDKGRKKLSDYATSRERGEGGQFIEAEEAHERADRLQRELDAATERAEDAERSLRVVRGSVAGSFGIEDYKEKTIATVITTANTKYAQVKAKSTAFEIRMGELLAKLDNPSDHAAALAAIDALKDNARHLQDGAQQLQREKAQLSNQVAEEERQNVAIAISFGFVGLLLGGAIMKVMGW